MTGGAPFVVSQEFAGWEGNVHTFDSLAAWGTDDFNLTGAGEPERIHAAAVSSGFLATLGVHPAMGRDFAASDGRAGSAGVTLLTDSFRKRHFAGSGSAIGRTLALNDQKYAVIGILPPDFRFPGDENAELLIPITGEGFAWTDRRSMMLQVLGKLHRGDTPQSAAAELQAITIRNGFCDSTLLPRCVKLRTRPLR